MTTCYCCKRAAHEINEYVQAVLDDVLDPNAVVVFNVHDYVRREEGTYNPSNDTFCCTDCYVAIGMPSTPWGWTAPDTDDVRACTCCNTGTFAPCYGVRDTGYGPRREMLRMGVCTNCGIMELQPDDTWKKYDGEL